MSESIWHCRIKSVRLKGGSFKLMIPETLKDFGKGTLISLEHGAMLISAGRVTYRVSE